MAIRNKSRNDALGRSLAFYDGNTDETTARFKPCVLDEDFIGPGHGAIPAAGSAAVGYPWVTHKQGAGSPTVTVLANSAAGIAQCLLTATSEKQEATLYANDQLNWDMTKYLQFEARAALATLPSATGVEAILGLQSAWIDGPDNNTFYCRFQANGSGLINCQTFDGTNTLTLSSGVTLVAGAFHIFRIDATSLTNIRFFIDGKEVSTGNFFSFGATGASAILQPYMSVYKPSGTGVGTLQVDMIQIGTERIA